MNNRKLRNITVEIKNFAEAYLRRSQTSRQIPRRWSGFLGAKVNGYIHVYQFSNDKLIGSIIIHPNNIKSIKNTLDNAVKSLDLIVPIAESEEESIDTTGDTSQPE